MKKLQELRAELKIVREYYHVLRTEGKDVKIFVSDDVKRLIEKCPLVLENAPKPVRRVYHGLYERGLTQKALAAEWNVTEKYVQILHKRLLLHLQSQEL